MPVIVSAGLAELHLIWAKADGEPDPVAAAHADLGLPIPRGTRLRLVKRSMGRLMWAFGRHQSLDILSVTHRGKAVEQRPLVHQILEIARRERPGALRRS